MARLDRDMGDLAVVKGVGVERVQHRAALTAEIESVLGREGVEHWVRKLNAAGVPTGPVLDIGQVFADPQVLAREMLVTLPHAEVGEFRTTGLPVKLSESPGRIERAPPLLGEHTDEVLAQAGLSTDEIASLREAGAAG